MQSIRGKLTYSNVVATLALILVLGGGSALAAKQMLPKNSVGTKQIKNGSVAAAKLKNGSVTAAKLAGGAVTAGTLANGAVTAANLAPGAVTSGAIADQAVNNSKLATGAVANGNLAADAVTSDKVKDGSLTSSDIAPNTFLPANGTAVNSQQLGGLNPAEFVRGKARFMSARVVVPAGQSREVLELNFAHIEGTCSAGSVPTQSLVAELNLENGFYTAINFGTSSTAPGTTEIGTANALTAGTSLIVPHTSVTPQSVTWQAAYNDGTDEVATAWVSDQDEGGSCVFIAQGTTTLG
ncbi:MAG: hypothetical protein JST59_08410 [Actinobacteria bacterium]|nr:hypothetical protein [Actinomycetota bacterium]